MNFVNFNSLIRVMQPSCKGLRASTCRLYFHLAASSGRVNDSKRKPYADIGLPFHNNGISSHQTGVQLFYQPTRYQVRNAKEDTGEIIESETKEKPFAELTVEEKVKRVGKDAYYTGIIIAGIGVTGIMFWAIGRELFSSETPTGIYGQAFKLCERNTEIEAAFGTPLKGYGKANKRGRRRYTNHFEFTDPDGVKHMRLKFYIEGPYKKGTVQLEVIKPERRFLFRYLFVEVDDFPPRTIVVEDNR